MFPPTKTLYVSIVNINISTEATKVPTLLSPYVAQADFPATISNVIKDLLGSFDANFRKTI